MKKVVTVSRKWNSPQITTTITNEEISLEMGIKDFEEALVKEIGSVTWVMTEAGFRKKLNDAIIKVISGIKEESAKVV